jgi:phage terminase large subunit GpA-like protein
MKSVPQLHWYELHCPVCGEYMTLPVMEPAYVVNTRITCQECKHILMIAKEQNDEFLSVAILKEQIHLPEKSLHRHA